MPAKRKVTSTSGTADPAVHPTTASAPADTSTVVATPPVVGTTTTGPTGRPPRPPRRVAAGSGGSPPPVVPSSAASGEKGGPAPPPMSPRTTIAMFSDKTRLEEDPQNVKVAVNSLARNLSATVKAALAMGENTSCTVNGRVYSKKELSDVARNLTRTVKRLPAVCRQVNGKRRRRATLSPEEKAKLRTVLHEKMLLSATSLATACDLQKMVPALVEKGEARVAARLAAGSNSPRTETGAIEKPFYISDTFRKFVAKAEFGNGWAFLYTLPPAVARISGAEKPDEALAEATKALGFDPAQKLGLTPSEAVRVANPRNVFSNLLVERGIATSPILMSLMSAYINANNLRDTTTNRIKVDECMTKFLGAGTNTEHVYSRKNLTPDELKEVCKLSGLERLAKRDTKSDVVPFDGKTFSRPMNIVLANYYRVSKPSEDLAAKLAHPAIADLCAGVKLYL
jgi:hypothetical protein